MRAEATRSGAAGADERGGIVGALIFVVVTLVLIATAPLPASHAAAGPHVPGSSATEAAK